MVERILQEAKTSFDFREFANPDDPLKSRFNEWIDHYKLKFAIAKTLQPRSILELGCGFGYSSRAFLEASPHASFVGIDRDGAADMKSAIEWARRITTGYAARFALATSQQMEHLPGGCYDLIHVAGEQDGLGTFHNLRRALSQARWVLLDSYFSTADIYLNANDFLRKYKDVIQHALVIPGFPGQLLIRVSDEYVGAINRNNSSAETSSSDIVGFYDRNYYLTDCGGYQGFRESGGKRITDYRLFTLLAISKLSSSGAALDLGCGRGEISYQLARSGREVTALDYSAASIELARGCFAGEDDELRSRVRFVCADASTFASPNHFGVVIVGDLIEHLASTELKRLYQNVAAQLERDGIFIVHTYPNRWFYKREYQRQRREVAGTGGFLPAEPRTRYELLMHLNEQSPAVLRRQLAKVFSHVQVWVGKSADPAKYLSRRASLHELVSAPEIFAIASHSRLDLERLIEALTMQPLPPSVADKTRFLASQWPTEVIKREFFDVKVEITNNSDRTLSSMPPHPVCIAYHWFEESGGKVVVFDGMRTMLPLPLEPGDTSQGLVATVRAPDQAGLYNCSMTLVQESCFWFDHASANARSAHAIRVV